MKISTLLTLLLILSIFSCNNGKQQSMEQLKVGKEYFNNDNFDSSLTCLNTAIKFDATNSEAYYYLSKTYYKIKDYKEGLKYLNLAEKQKFNPDSIETLKLKILFALEKYDDYIDYCNKKISKNSSNYEMYLNKARALYNKSNNDTEYETELLKEALENINISLNLNKNNNETFVVRGGIRRALSDYKGAISDFDLVINQEKKDSAIISRAYRFKGLTEENLNNLSNAETLLDSAIIFNKKHSSLYIDRGYIRVSLKKIDLACEDYRKALDYGDKDAVDWIRENCK